MYLVDICTNIPSFNDKSPGLDGFTVEVFLG